MSESESVCENPLGHFLSSGSTIPQLCIHYIQHTPAWAACIESSTYFGTVCNVVGWLCLTSHRQRVMWCYILELIHLIKPASHCLTDWRIGGSGGKSVEKSDQWENLRRVKSNNRRRSAVV